jgi:hypothetical protein
LAGSGAEHWAARVVARDGAGNAIVVHRLALGTATGADSVLASFPGDHPSICERHDGSLVVAYLEPRAPGVNTVVVRRGSSDGKAWSPPLQVSRGADGYELASARLVETHQGRLVLPVVRRVPRGSSANVDPAAREVLCLTSRNGSEWSEGKALVVPAGADPAVAEAASGTLVLVVRVGTWLKRSISKNEGESWSPLSLLDVTTLAAEHALAGEIESGQIALAWVEVENKSCAPPELRPLWVSFSADAGEHWHDTLPLELWPNVVPSSPSVRFLTPERVTSIFERRSGDNCSLVCRIQDVEFESSTSAAATATGARGAYSFDRAAAREALRVLCAHTLARPGRAAHLYVEGYFMRTLVAAGEVLGDSIPAGEERLDTRAALARAVAFADSLVTSQNSCGYWDLGYYEGWTADMAAALGIFPALEPHVDEEHRTRYQGSAERFLAGLERDRFFLRSGAVSVGWRRAYKCDGTFATSPSDSGRSDEPYLVSTSLAGLEIQSWMYHRTRAEIYKQRALKALEYTLSQIGPDGSVVGWAGKEGPFLTAAYVEEGWIAADSLLGDPAVHARLQSTLPRHVDWLLRSQREDGSWGDPDGESARSPTIANFLIWYDQTCERRDDVREAVRRAGASYLDPARWRSLGLFRREPQYEVLRAIVGRALAAAARGHFVL